MEKKLQDFLHKAFAPYGDFPAKEDITNELLANLTEKYHDFKKEGKSDEAAYQATVDSFGNAEEIMEQLPHTQKTQTEAEDEESGIQKTLKDIVRRAKATIGLSKFSAINLENADLSDSDLHNENFSFSSLTGARFDRSNLSHTSFTAASLKNASLVDATIANATFAASNLQNADLTNTNAAGTKFIATGLKGITIKNTTLTGTQFKQCDLSDISFEGLELQDTVFSGSSLKGAVFKNAIFKNVVFKHSEVKHADFSGASMDKVTYAILKGAKATLEDVKIV